MGAEVNNRDSGERYAAHAAAKVGKGFSPLLQQLKTGFGSIIDTRSWCQSQEKVGNTRRFSWENI
jgi:hypothetical protein